MFGDIAAATTTTSSKTNDWLTTKLPPNSKRAQELTAAVVQFIVRDLKPICIVDSDGFLNLMNVAEPRYAGLCRRKVSNYLDQKYLQ